MAPTFPLTGSIAVGLKLLSWLCAVWNGLSVDQRTPRFRVRFFETFQSSCKYRLWMVSRGSHVLVYDVLKVLMSDLFKMLNTSTLPVTVVRPNFILREARKSTLFRDGETCVPGSMSAIEAMLPDGLRLSAALISAADGVYSAVICGPGSIEQAHKPDEYVDLAQIAQCEAFLERLRGKLAA